MRSRVRWLGSALGVLLAFGVVASCTPEAGHVPPASLNAELDRTVAAAGALPWSSKTRITWADYRGVVPATVGDEGAQTGYSLYFGVRCTGRLFQFGVVAALLPRDSWVTPAVLADPRLNGRTLGHEQTHFDLTEVFARRMRKFFTTLDAPCLKSDGDLDALAERYVADEKAEQALYDTDTGHGLTAARQSAWNRQVSDELTALAAFAR